MPILVEGICDPLSVSNGWIVHKNSLINGKYPVNTLAFVGCNTGYSREGPYDRKYLASGK